MPPAAITSASDTLAQVTPIAPASSCFSAMAGVLWHFWCGRPEASRDAFARFCDLATKRTVSYGWFGGTLLRTARLSEEVLNDTETAGRYYKRMITEAPSHARSYFALKRAVALGAITPDEIRALKLHGITDDVIAELFKEKKDD